MAGGAGIGGWIEGQRSMINPKWLNIAGLVLNIAGTWDQVIE